MWDRYRRHICASRCSRVIASGGLGVSVVVERIVGGSAERRSSSRISHVRVVAGTVVAGRRSEGTMGGGRSDRDGRNLRVAKLFVELLTLPELFAGTLGVAVVWAGTKAVLLFVMAAEHDLNRYGDKKENAGNC